MRPKTERLRLPRQTYDINVIGRSARPLLDFYHGLMELTWTATLAVVAVAFLFANALFALAFVAIGGIAHAAPGSFADAFFFSVQTMGTIGYGVMYPESRAANELVVLEALVSVLLTALTTGLVFAKFSRPTAHVVFAREAVIGPHDGKPTLMLRLGNARKNLIVDAHLRVVLVRTEHLAEGQTFYRMLDLKLQRDNSLSLTRSWTILHVIDAESPLFGETPESFAAKETELQVLMVGLDDTSMQIVHASHQYLTGEVLWGMRHRDILKEEADGSMTIS